ncbi:MAG: ArnT family glycosyltransferase, partial [Ignavibacteria bacterium]
MDRGIEPRRLAAIFFIAIIIFVVGYTIFLKKFFIGLIKGNNDFLDRIYYLSIFSNLEYAAVLTLLFFCLFYFSRQTIFKFMYSLNDKKLLFSALSINFILQFLILIFVNTIPIADSKYYIQNAETLYSTGSYLNQNGLPTSFWPVGLPAYLAFLKYLFNDYLFAARFINIILSSLLIFILFKIFLIEFSKKQRIIFLFSFVFFLNNLFSSNVLMTDYQFTFFLWLAIFILIKYDYAILHLALIGIILGLISYLRPISLLLPTIIFIYFLKNSGIKRALLKSFIVTAAMLLVLSPWIYRNYMVFNKFIPVSTNGGFNFLMGNHNLSSGGLNFDFNYDINNPDEPLEERKAYLTAFDDIISQPFKAFLRLPKKIIYSYLRGDSSITWALKSTRNQISP